MLFHHELNYMNYSVERILHVKSVIANECTHCINLTSLQRNVLILMTYMYINAVVDR